MSKDTNFCENVSITNSNNWHTYTSFAAAPTGPSTLMAGVAGKRIMVTDINIESNTTGTWTLIKDVGGAASAAAIAIRHPFQQSTFVSLRNPIVLPTGTALGLHSLSTVSSISICGYLD